MPWQVIIPHIICCLENRVEKTGKIVKKFLKNAHHGQERNKTQGFAGKKKIAHLSLPRQRLRRVCQHSGVFI